MSDDTRGRKRGGSDLQNFKKRRKIVRTQNIPERKIYVPGEEGPGGDTRGDRKEGAEGEERVKIPKRKVALMFGYCGAGYYGMQIQSKLKTIESDMQASLVSGGFITADNADSLHKVGWMRAARTDKGVHAAGQVVSVKLLLDPALTPEQLVAKMNAHMPPAIRIYGMPRVTGGFNAKNACDCRRYEYLIPSYALDATNFGRINELLPGITEYTFKKRRSFGGALGPDAKPLVIPDEIANYRVTPEVLAHLNKLLGLYVGTKNFHNFTSKRSANDPSATRYIMSFTAEAPFMLNGVEIVRCTVIGQSFVLHQIRKMIGLAIAVLRRPAIRNPEPLYQQALSKAEVHVPMAPSNGLLLDQCMYRAYNSSKDNVQGPISFDDYGESREEFKRSCIYAHMMSIEEKEYPMLSWLSHSDRNAGIHEDRIDPYGSDSEDDAGDGEGGGGGGGGSDKEEGDGGDAGEAGEGTSAAAAAPEDVVMS